MADDAKNFADFLKGAIESGLCLDDSRVAAETWGQIISLEHNLGNIYVPQDAQKVKALVEFALNHAKRVGASPYDVRYGYTMLYPSRVTPRVSFDTTRTIIVFAIQQPHNGHISLAEWLRATGHEVPLGKLY